MVNWVIQLWCITLTKYREGYSHMILEIVSRTWSRTVPSFVRGLQSLNFYVSKYKTNIKTQLPPRRGRVGVNLFVQLP